MEVGRRRVLLGRAAWLLAIATGAWGAPSAGLHMVPLCGGTLWDSMGEGGCGGGAEG